VIWFAASEQRKSANAPICSGRYELLPLLGMQPKGTRRLLYGIPQDATVGGVTGAGLASIIPHELDSSGLPRTRALVESLGVLDVCYR
jgi:hypothetical protein